MSPELRAFKAAIEQAIRRYLPTTSPIAQSLVDAMRHAVLGGGKRLRPLFVCAACGDLGGRVEDALAPACAVEFMHAYSLVHDDLPAMDDDALRHGLPSCHVAYGEATAILAGDALQALAFETLAGAPDTDPALCLLAMRRLGSACGWAGMAGGQCFDLASGGSPLNVSEVRALHAAKTGALIRVAVELGALFARAGEERLVVVGEFAERIGLAFQVMDDVLDITQSTETLGKPAGSDVGANKSTFPALMGVESAREEARLLLGEALECLQRVDLRDGRLAELARLAVDRDH